MSKILIVDDDPSVLGAFRQLLAGKRHEVNTAARGEAALALVKTDKPDLVVMDVRLPGMSGLDVFRRIKESDPRLPVIIMTGYATMDTAIEAMKLGAFDYHVKPPNPEDILRSIEEALDCVRLMSRPVELDTGAAAPSGEMIVGQSKAMQEVYKAIGRVAETEATVLIRGETGTGKELAARAIYQHSRRASAPLIVVNCAAIPENLLESELFGHERGAFTGAESRRIGKFEQAHAGTIFLDEIGDMSPGVQAKILRVLQEQAFERVGGSETIRTDARVLAATNRNLEAAIGQGRFREDLYHRLRVFTIHVAPLRERREDIPRLAGYFLEQFARELGIEKPLLSTEAMEALLERPWMGNVRELQHCIHRAMIFTKGYPIRREDIARSLESAATGGPSLSPPPDADALREVVRNYVQTHAGGSTHSDFVDMVERLLLSEALRLAQGNQTHAARRLGLSRPTLKAKLDKYGLGRGKPLPDM